jgi:glycosyltransferase involved in cell wall biosynthesis
VVLSVYDHAGNPHYGGGGAAVVAGVAARLVAEGHRVTVYSGSYRGCRSGSAEGVRYRFLPVGWAGPRGGQVLFQLLLPLVLLLRRPALWLESLTPPASASLLPVAGGLVGCPVAGIVQMLCGADMQRRYGLPFEALERHGLRLYRRLVVLNEVDARAVRGMAPRAEVTVIPNGIATRAWDGTPGTGPVLFLGRVDVRQKGLDLLVEALPAGLELVVAGSGTRAEEQRLREVAAGRPEVRIVGRVDGAAKDELLAGCAFVVVPSRYETFCLTALEAMAHGRPVVHFALDRLGWIGPAAGLAVPAFDVDALREAIGRLAGDAELRERMGRAARARSLDFDEETVGRRYAALVRALLAEPPGAAQRRSRLRTAESRSRVSVDIRRTRVVRSRAVPATAARWAGPTTRLRKICSRICARVPVARSALYASSSPSRSSSVIPGSAKA